MITHHETALHKQEPRSMKERPRGGINMLSDDESQVQKGGEWEPDANTQGLCLLNLVNPPEKKQTASCKLPVCVRQFNSQELR